MGVNSLPKTVTRQRRGCDLYPGPSAPESSTLTTRLPSHPTDESSTCIIDYPQTGWVQGHVTSDVWENMFNLCLGYTCIRMTASQVYTYSRQLFSRHRASGPSSMRYSPASLLSLSPFIEPSSCKIHQSQTQFSGSQCRRVSIRSFPLSHKTVVNICYVPSSKLTQKSITRELEVVFPSYFQPII